MSEEQKAAFTAITELIGEMAWGVGLPCPMEVEIFDNETGESVRRAVRPLSYKPVFEAIYQKLQTCEDYDPLNSYRDTIATQREELAAMVELLSTVNCSHEEWGEESCEWCDKKDLAIAKHTAPEGEG